MFTGKERDSESGLDYFWARYYGSGLGRFTSPDPIYFQREMLGDPQRLNLYAYVRNSPLTLLDPTGQAIQLKGNATQRQDQIDALCKMVGGDCADYLYDNVGDDGNHYVGIYTNGKSGAGPDLGDLNDVASAFKDISNDPTIATLSVVPADSNFRGPGGKMTNLATLHGGVDGATLKLDGRINIYVRDSGYSGLSLFDMSGWLPGDQDVGTVSAHEWGHAAVQDEAPARSRLRPSFEADGGAVERVGTGT